MTYIEGRRRIKIDCEFHSDPLGIHIFTGDEWRWDDGVVLTDDEKLCVEENLVEYHESRGYEVTIRS